MTASSPRVDLGLSLVDAASLIGVGRETLTRYELDPMAVGESRRRRIAAFYRDLQWTIERARKRRDTSGEASAS
jgi:predicted transcriptional regulator